MAYQLLKALLLPPADLFLLGLAGWLVGRRWRRLGRTMVGLSVVLLYLLSTPLVARQLIAPLQIHPALAPDAVPDPAAGVIVVLGAGQRSNAAEFGGATIGGYSLERVRYGAVLARRFGLPVLIAGGTPQEGLPPVAQLMGRVLAEEFGVTARWQETKSPNTRENARLSQEILAREGISTIYLVTHAWHMPRAKAAFERAGLQVLPAPTAAVDLEHEITAFNFVPSARALWLSALACHEYLGRLWYSLG